MKWPFGSGLMEWVNSSRNATAALVLGAACFFPSFAFAIPLGTTQAAAGCYPNGDIYDYPYQYSALGPAPVGLTAECDYSVTFTDRDGLAGGYAQTSATARTGFGPGFPLVGNVDATANVDVMGNNAPLVPIASAGGNVTFYFASESYRPGPLNPPNLPIYFEAHGQNTQNYGSSSVSVSLAYSGLGVVGWNSASPSSDHFDHSTTIWLTPGNVATVHLDANCYTYAIGSWDYSDPSGIPTPVAADGNCKAHVDPTIRFDQAAFDALYGANSFTLTDYYRLQFSENVVPIPPAVWLFGSGLLGLIAVARRKVA